MTDAEKRAHDLAVMYARYTLDRDNAQKDEYGLTVLDDEVSVWATYKNAYTTFLPLMED